MQKLTLLAAVAATAAGAAACSKAGGDDKKLDEIAAKLDGIDKRLNKLETFLKPFMNQPPPPPEPDPAATYSVPVEGNFGMGPAVALVTVVEAFDYG